jgi:hypothetical protein
MPEGASPAQPPAKRPAQPLAQLPAQLPADVRGFVGRVDQLAALDAIADTVGAEPTAVVISAIAGTAGAGKTALAVHWAHRVADRFPDGQLYVNLRGFDPGRTLDPADAIRAFLDALGVPPQRIPTGRDAMAALYRSRLADKRMLVLLDNARDADQVRPLLPGAPGCLVLVTSRNRLTSLIATAAAHPVPLDLFTTAEARDLLTHRLGHLRATTEPDAVDLLITRCARLPLALAIVAARGATNSHTPLTTLATELADARTRLDTLADAEPATDLRAVFSWSYTTLSRPAARLFRLLGLHPGPDLATPAAASLAGLAPTEMRHCWPNSSRPTCSSNTSPAGTPPTTCSATTPPTSRTPSTPPISGTPPPAASSTTTSIPPTPRTGFSTTPGTGSPSRGPDPGSPPSTPRPPRRPWPGSAPNTGSCSRP